MNLDTFADLCRRIDELRRDNIVGSDRPSSRFEAEDGSGVIQGTLSAADADTAGGRDTERTQPTPVVRRGKQELGIHPRGKHWKK